MTVAPKCRMVALAAALFCALMGAFGSPGFAQEKIRLSYSALSPSTAFLWLPKEKGFFKKHGLKVEILLIESGSLSSQALASGEIGIADNAGAPAIISNASGSGETIIMGLVNSLAYNLIATKQAKDISDLKNRRIGVSRIGSSSHAAVGLRSNISTSTPSATTSRMSKAAP